MGDVARIIRTGAQRLIAAVMDCEKPVIAAVNGTAAGLGGVLVEVLKEVTFRVPPFSKAEAGRMVAEVRGSSLLPASGPVVDTIMKVQKLALDCGDTLSELDINPLVSRKKDAMALDALVVGR